MNYTITENELLAWVYPADKFKFYLMDAKVIVHTNRCALKYLLQEVGCQD